MKKLKRKYKQWMMIQSTRELNKRKKRNEVQNQAKARRSRRRLTETLLKLSHQAREYEYIKKLSKNCRGYLHITKNVNVSLPKKFSLIETPEKSLEVISKLLMYGRKRRNFELMVDHRNTTSDYSAISLLTFCTHFLAKRTALRRNRRPAWGGVYPDNKQQQRLISAVGMASMDMTIDIGEKADKFKDRSDYVHFKRDSHRESEVAFGSQSLTTRTIMDFEEYLNECLAKCNLQLSQTGSADIGEYIGEILDNVEWHSGDDLWYVRGYLDGTINNPSCELVIFNFGQSIANSFKNLPENHFARKEIDPYVNKHKDKEGITEENLYVVASLQDGWSSKNSKASDTRGQGMIGLVEFFQQLSDECNYVKNSAKLSIISGNTHILFDGKYKPAYNMHGKIRVIAFNEENDLNKGPDPKYVKRLGSMIFPGTYISIKFPVSAHLEAIVKST